MGSAAVRILDPDSSGPRAAASAAVDVAMARRVLLPESDQKSKGMGVRALDSLLLPSEPAGGAGGGATPVSEIISSRGGDDDPLLLAEEESWEELHNNSGLTGDVISAIKMLRFAEERERVGGEQGKGEVVRAPPPPQPLPLSPPLPPPPVTALFTFSAA